MECFVCKPDLAEAHKLLLQFPVIFPYGKGGLSCPGFKQVNFPTLAKWCIKYADKRFRKHKIFVHCLLWEVQEYQMQEQLHTHAETSNMTRLPFLGAKLDTTQIEKVIVEQNMEDCPYMIKLESVVHGLTEYLPGMQAIVKIHESELFGMTLANNLPNLLITIHNWLYLEHIGQTMRNNVHNHELDQTLHICTFNSICIHDTLVCTNPYIPTCQFN